MSTKDKKLLSELQSFKEIWKGGYLEGYPLDPLSESSYNQLGYISVLHATYLRCIKPYINFNTIALEIGPGRGAWTKTLLPSKEVWVLDALSEQYNLFYDYLQNPPNVKYFQVNDFKCEMLPNNYFTYMFSFGCLCHVSFEGITKYAANLYPKLKVGCNCFWMIADYEKYNNAILNLDNLSIWTRLMPKSKSIRSLPLRWLLKLYMKRNELKPIEMDVNNDPKPGRWYNAGIKRTCSMLKQIGYQIVDSDIETCIRDPIIHFTKV